MKLFYDEVKGKRKNKCVRLQIDNEFQQVKIKDLKITLKCSLLQQGVEKHLLPSKK